MKFANAKKMIADAYKNKYAIPHININNLEWAKAVLLTAQEFKSPLIIGVSEGAVKYMGGYKTVRNMVEGLLGDLNITVPIVLHLDHGTKEGCFKAINAGFSSVMFDGSSLPFETNYESTKQVVEYAKKFDVSVESEVGTIGGEEDGIIGSGELADTSEALKMTQLGIDMLAAGVGNIHGKYPPTWKSLDFNHLENLSTICKIGLVLHGGSGIPKDQVSRAIKLGIAKINVNTELQLAFHEALRNFIITNKDLEGKNYDPRKLLANSIEAMKLATKEKIFEFGSNDKA
ncbi:class II fructose-1,6-bisphosphate aldolase [Mycoplasma sp. ES3157-GEN-MYC]|uniref:Class II fructose-1,6-bisphosphate aldolase n=1 Tax=Mycoplasma miroungigenitalium TaxID=754515 RepID=A0A6M4JC52_9MOLU|nr:class II fructose-1,6-bisphosphate aldolase [Mycoplasma miroungigenitalium]MBU4690520.1 class II fructose-1,6-bisphosphate aldolase [Mycoplasma miroungigenitalium]MBU4691787.1 class II fructose-1,6-bisphosphate aldolase [Mycoplasma miroungigenitalium]QJR43848.1 class II fructose-1,6-bisphosphate aldolase [Mycoplasma miroungigenitalium]